MHASMANKQMNKCVTAVFVVTVVIRRVVPGPPRPRGKHCLHPVNSVTAGRTVPSTDRSMSSFGQKKEGMIQLSGQMR
jgi:hypothetical protein